MNKILKLDWVMLVSVLLLLAIGLLALYSLSFPDGKFNPTNFKKQIISIILGLALMFFLSMYDYEVLGNGATPLYFFGISLLILVIFFGTSIRGTTGWIGFGMFHIQPVEIVKIIMVIFLASFLSKKKNQFSIAIRIIASVVLVFFPVFLIIRQPDFGSAAIIIGSWALMLFICGLNKKNVLILFLIVAIIATASWFFLKEYQKERVWNFVQPQNDPRGSGYNAIQSIVAVGSGGFWGKGLGHGSQSQLNFLPEKHTDFIFAAICEELGFIGAFAVLALFGVIFYRMKEIAAMSSGNLGYLITSGFMVMLFLQVFVNIGMNIGVSPVTGVPLPFLSYGGSSMVMILSSIGIIQNIYLKRSKSYRQ
jgi:rod shape determining protein RodA